ncbi:hypothetical protein [Fictibacillus sp. 18YEL24]|uniref:hypothetical protein n=1 Tax=Fictibacillus sp. 18YEL24 TaxID=2745875 RepID=UPI0018CDF454|nr:hypothetical protein [Fictibacillus sp. 18YEL24]MBH0169303.1 hypothetical protein [Fictibacillus sp. 18YEL24]
MTNEEKIKKVIEMYEEGYEVKDIARAVGYSHPKSLSRFMGDMQYKWDNVKKNYVYQVNTKKASSKTDVKTEKAEKKTTDPLDLLEDNKVISLLQHSEKLLGLLHDKNNTDSNQQSKSGYSFWRKAQEFAFTKKANYTTSVRLPIDLHERFKTFGSMTNLSQTQLICMSIDYFIERFESKATK